MIVIQLCKSKFLIVKITRIIKAKLNKSLVKFTMRKSKLEESYATDLFVSCFNCLKKES